MTEVKTKEIPPYPYVYKEEGKDTIRVWGPFACIADATLFGIAQADQAGEKLVCLYNSYSPNEKGVYGEIELSPEEVVKNSTRLN